MAAVVFTCRRFLLAAALVLGGCSASVPAPDGHESEPHSAVDGGTGSVHGPDSVRTMRWPGEGWLWMEVEVHVALDEAVEIDTRGGLAAAWRPGHLELWIEVVDPLDRDNAVTVHRVKTGVEADDVVVGLQGRFQAGIELRPQGRGAHGGLVFVATERDVDTTVSQRWEIGHGEAPWPLPDPFDSGS